MRIVRPKAILFDWDNTLIDSWPVIHDALNATFAAFGRQPWTLAETKARVRQSMRDSFPALFGERWRQAGKVFYDRFTDVHLAKLTPRPGAEAMLSALHEAGFYLGVVSNKRGDVLRREADRLGWADYFGRIVGAMDAKRDKPASETVALALDGSHVAPGDRVWIAGDANIDMELAVKAGCVPVLVRQEAPKTGEFGAFAPVLHVEDCLTLCKLACSL